jgi:hypothetical protein
VLAAAPIDTFRAEVRGDLPGRFLDGAAANLRHERERVAALFLAEAEKQLLGGRDDERKAIFWANEQRGRVVLAADAPRKPLQPAVRDRFFA